MDVPRLTTARLELRGHTLSDFNDSLAMWSDPRVAQFIGGRPSSAEEVWSRLLRYIGMWPALGYRYWVVSDLESGRFIGEVGLANFHRDISPPIADPEAGWALVPSAFGQGFATEALGAVLGWADDHLTASRTMCMIAPENEASVRVASKVGYSRLVGTRYKEVVTVLYERQRGFNPHLAASPNSELVRRDVAPTSSDA